MTSFKQQKEQEIKLATAAQALDRAKAERSAQIQLHLKKLGEDQAEDEQMLNIVVQAVLQADGLPLGDAEDFVLRAEHLAERICRGRRNREWSQVRDLLAVLNARDPNVVMVRAAARAGVELVPGAAPAVIVPEPPRLVTEG